MENPKLPPDFKPETHGWQGRDTNQYATRKPDLLHRSSFFRANLLA